MLRKVLSVIVVFGFLGMALAADTVYLRNGGVVSGNIRSFENNRFIISTANRRDSGADAVVNVRDVLRIQFDGQGTAQLREVRRSLDVFATQPLSSSGVIVRNGDRVIVEASGEIYLDRNRRSGSGGLTTSTSGKPLARENWGALYATVGNYPNEAFVVGQRKEFFAPRDGEIFFGINDGFLADNSGSFRLTIITFEPEENTAGASRREAFPQEEGLVESRVEARADMPWTDTGIRLRAGDRVVLDASGSIEVARNKPSGPEGVTAGLLGTLLGTMTVPNQQQGALLGQIRGDQNSEIFLVGNHAELVVPVNGTLFLGINDDNFSNNSGSYVVTVRSPQGRSRRF
jgi:hypothetical protein